MRIPPPPLATWLGVPAAIVAVALATLGLHPAPVQPPAETSAQTPTQTPAQTPARASHGAALDPATRLDDRIDREQLLQTLSVLAHDSMQGRRTGTPGNERARRFLLLSFDRLGLEPVNGVRSQEFRFTSRRDSLAYEGLNVMGIVEGTRHPERVIVVTAHYDHLGAREGEIFNGADDNASGTAALLALARYFLANRPAHSIAFAALDAEELGLEGARAFLDHPPLPLDRIVMNVNLDMISRSDVRELYAAGTYHYPFLTPLVEEVASGSRVSLLMGHDRPGLPPGDDWTTASDHGPFHQRGIPFLYFGVEDHPGYHNPSDTFENITPDFYVDAVETILDLLLVADREGEMIYDERRAARRGPGG